MAGSSSMMAMSFFMGAQGYRLGRARSKACATKIAPAGAGATTVRHFSPRLIDALPDCRLTARAAKPRNGSRTAFLEVGSPNENAIRVHPERAPRELARRAGARLARL